MQLTVIFAGMSYTQNTLIIFFDGYCALCNSSVSWTLKKDKHHLFKYAPLSGDTASKIFTKSNDIPDSIVVWTGNKLISKSNAALFIAKKLPFPWKLLYIFILIPKFIRDYIYDLIASNRYRWFGKHDTCRLPSESEKNYFLS